MEYYQKLILNLCGYPGKEFALSRLSDAHKYFFSSPWAYGRHLCSTVLNAVKYSVYVWETNPLFTCFFFDKIFDHNMAVITTRLVYLKQFYSQERWKLHQRNRNGQKRLERLEPSPD